MKLAFDLISDLHVETWPEPFDWTGMATSMICVVAGDVSRDREKVVETLKHLGTCYRAVFYIDGNDEHRHSLGDLGESYKTLAEELEKIPNVVYLQDNVVIVDGVAFIGTNGWWGYDLDPYIDYDKTREWFIERYKVDKQVADSIEAMSLQDFAYLAKSIEKLQTHNDVKSIVVVTHTAPLLQLVDHDPEISGTPRLNCVGNSNMLRVLTGDTELKVATWCFGHYHGDVDRVFEDIRFVNNCKGRGDTPWSKSVYYPKRIEVNF